MPEQKEMSFLQHLEELRWHLVRSLIAIMVFATVAFISAEILFTEVVFAPSRKEFITYRWLCDLGELLSIQGLCFNALPAFVEIQMGSQFTWHIWGSLIAGFVVAFPYVAWELWRFIKPALHATEKKKARGMVFYMSFLFLTGIAFGYFILAPLAVHFLAAYNVMPVTKSLSFTSYISTVLNVVIACGVLFEMPVVIYFLARVGLVSPEFLKKYRKHALIVILLLSAIITPPDVASQIIVAIPLAVLYEISIHIAKRTYRRKQAS